MPGLPDSLVDSPPPLQDLKAAQSLTDHGASLRDSPGSHVLRPHLPQPEELTNILEICNVVFTSMFALEMILKLAAFGLFDYLRNPYNIFDSIIVIIR